MVRGSGDYWVVGSLGGPIGASFGGSIGGWVYKWIGLRLR